MRNWLKIFSIVVLIYAVAILIWASYKRQIIEVPEEVREFSKVFPLLDLMDHEGCYTVCWEWEHMDWDVFKNIYQNKGTFENGYMYGEKDGFHTFTTIPERKSR